MAITTSILRAGDMLDGFRIDELIGHGGTAIVYRAEQISLGRPVALKVLSDHLARDDAFRERFRREGKHLAAFEHPHIVPVYDSGEQDGLLYLVMRLVDGTNLAELIRDRKIDAERTISILKPIANALDAAHADELLHRDVKPQNILVTERGHPYLADFGVAKGSNTYDLTATGGFVGSVNYASPEQIQGSTLTPASDIYALAAVLYTCLTGEVPYPRESDPAIMYAHLHEPPPRLRGAGENELCAAIARGMGKEPESRYPCAHDLLEAASRAMIAMSPARRRQIPAFPTGNSGDLEQPLSAANNADLRPLAATAADQRRKIPLGAAPASVTPSRRWPLVAATASVLFVAIATVGFFVLSGGSPRASAAHRATLDLAASLAPAEPPRASLAIIRSHSLHSLAKAETLLAAGDEQAAVRLSRLPPSSSARQRGIATLIASLSHETAATRKLAAAAKRDDHAAYARSLARFPAVQGNLLGVLHAVRALGFSTPSLRVIPASALAPSASRGQTRRHSARPKPATTASPAPTVSVSTTPVTPVASQPVEKSVSPPAASHTAPTYHEPFHKYAPTVVSPPVG